MGHEVCISKPRILVSRVLCGHSGEEHKSDKGIHRESIEDRQRRRSIESV